MPQGLKPGALARALSAAKSPPVALTPPNNLAELELLAALGSFVSSGRHSDEIFTPAQSRALVAKGWAFEHDTPKPGLILTDAGWRAAGRAT